MIKNVQALHAELQTLNPDKSIILQYADTAFPKIVIDSNTDELNLPDDFNIFEEDGRMIISNNLNKVGTDYHYIRAEVAHQLAKKRPAVIQALVNIRDLLKDKKDELKYNVSLKLAMPRINKAIDQAILKQAQKNLENAENEEEVKSLVNLNVLFDKLVFLNPDMQIESNNNEVEPEITYYSHDGAIVVPRGFKIVQEDPSVKKYIITNRLTDTKNRIYTCSIKCRKLS